MAFVKVVKNKAYFKRFQVKNKRRREGKTDYRARRQMILQDKTKFGAPKYRMVVRFTNSDIVAQIVHAKIAGDDVIQAAYAHELKNYGINFGLTNYAAAYCTGLLLARRTLSKLGLADKFQGAKEATGAYEAVRTKKDDQDDDESRFPFKAVLDVGLARTTTGARIFGVLKGAVDGGIAVPHRPNRFPGFNSDKDALDAKVHRDRIFGKHVADYFKQVKEEVAGNPDEKINQFGAMIKAKVNPSDIEGIYKKAHAAIRADPSKKAAKKAVKAGKRKEYGQKKQTYAVRTEAAKKKIATLRQRMGI
jgi:large subunit ribosomal protein L5e